MVVKSQSIFQHVADLKEVLGELHKYDMHLNLERCTFGVGGGKFLGFMITHRWIEAIHNKCITILEMHSPTNVQEVQKLNGRLASISKFFPKLAEKWNLRDLKSIPMGWDLRASLLCFQEDHCHTTNPESTQARSTLPLISLNSWQSF